MQWAYISFVGCHKLKIETDTFLYLTSFYFKAAAAVPGISVAYAPPTASLRGGAPPAATVPNRQSVTSQGSKLTGKMSQYHGHRRRRRRRRRVVDSSSRTTADSEQLLVAISQSTTLATSTRTYTFQAVSYGF